MLLEKVYFSSITLFTVSKVPTNTANIERCDFISSRVSLTFPAFLGNLKQIFYRKAKIDFQTTEEFMPPAMGTKAPPFSLPDTNRKPRSLSEFLGKKTVLAFFPGAFTGVCTKEMCTFRDSLSKLNDLNAHVVAISVDSPFANKAFADANKLTFPVLSDYSREVIKSYGIVHDGFAGLKGYTAAKRSVFVLDKDGVVKYVWVSENPGVEPPYEEVIKALSSIR